MDLEFQRLKALVTIPYLPPIPNFLLSSQPIFTLVLDLDETLIHLECDDEDDQDNGNQTEHEDGVYYLIRPGTIRFLNELSKYYEIVIFTAAMPDYADWIMDNVDRHRVVSHRLYRQHTSPHEDYAIKDLRNLGRSLERTIIIDNLEENFMHTTPTNGIWVESWYDDMDDNVLELLTPFLKRIVQSNMVQDVRQLLTNDIKDKVIYPCLKEGRDIPSVEKLLQGEY
ncbi:hypothetical protein FGO68_gene15839 [Halteria grandinella]|uniref:Mitochondrial import inner membrane translocase subunit TIM50 n=1 Tax=Halteria grandinella TaxID=5974 RepID=A0A8J8NFJ0_HALGN|nr:hypothetical protein FGO68_gene15839 [Halteria grandinella]